MAASKSQGRHFGTFLVGLMVLSAGVGYSATAMGKVLLLTGAGVLLVSFAGFIGIKPLEGETPLERSPEAMKWIGAGIAAAGWLITLGGLHVVETNGSRTILALLGIGVSLFGMLYVLPAAFNKKAFWKAPGKAARTMSAVAGGVTLDSELSAASRAMGGTK
jgi:hypothetical protein